MKVQKVVSLRDEIPSSDNYSSKKLMGEVSFSAGFSQESDVKHEYFVSSGKRSHQTSSHHKRSYKKGYNLGNIQ